MSRREPDWVDLVCNDWAREKRKYLGIILPEHLKHGKIVGGLEPRERIGKLRCTLAAVREEGAGASYGVTSQVFPEVFRGDALVVNQAWASMPQGTKKQLMFAHYVWKEIPITVIAEELNLEPARYYEVYEAVKIDLQQYLNRLGIENPTEAV